MMTADMDRLLTAPGRRPADDDAAPHPGGPPTAVTPPAVPPPPAPDGGAPDHRPFRRLAAAVLVGALTMFGVATLDSFAGATVPVLGSFASLPAPAEPELVEVPPPPATPGTCLTWNRPDAADTSVVDCSGRHLFEQAGSVRLTDQEAVPDDRLWRQLVDERCTPVVLDYLDGRFDPDGRYRVGALKPSPAKWAEGDRELRCGLQSASRSGALYPFDGRVAQSDQSAVHEPGTCLAIDGRSIGDPIGCAGPHAVEAVGVVDLAGRFPEAFPQVGDQDGFLQPECGRIATEYAGGPEVIAAKKLTVYWDNLTEESWKAGTRKVNCNLAALLPDRSGFAPVTGPVRGDVVVGETPAPPATGTPQPGTPVTPSTAPPAPTTAPSAADEQDPPATPVGPPTGTSTVPAPPPPAGELSAPPAPPAPEPYY